jgi:hypothetical protein
LKLQVDECRESLKMLKERFPASKATAEVIVLLAIKEQSPAAAVEQLKVRCHGIHSPLGGSVL